MDAMPMMTPPVQPALPTPYPLPERRELYTPRVLFPRRLQDLTADLGVALDAATAVRDELQPADVSVNLAKREARPVASEVWGTEVEEQDSAGAPAPHGTTDREPRGGNGGNGGSVPARSRFPWVLSPIGSFSGEPELLRDRAFQQLLARVRYRRDHLERFPAGFQHRMLNWLIQAGGNRQHIVLRTVRGHEVRALVTDSYTPFDDVDLLDAVSTVLGEQPDLAATARIAWMDLREDASHLRVVWGTEEPLRVGDPVLRGIHISNSEVGVRSVRIEAVILRLVCFNGMLAPSSKGSLVLRHVGDRERLLGAVREAVEDATLDTERILAEFRQSLRVPIPDPLTFLTAVAREEPLLTQEDLRAALFAWEQAGAERTLFGVTNALSAAAQGLPGDRRYEVEALAGRVMRRELAAV